MTREKWDIFISFLFIANNIIQKISFFKTLVCSYLGNIDSAGLKDVNMNSRIWNKERNNTSLKKYTNKSILVILQRI